MLINSVASDWSQSRCRKWIGMAGKLEEQINSVMTPRLLHYSTVYSQCYSPCGQYLAVATNYGKICIFNLRSALNLEFIADQEKDYRESIFSFHAHSGKIYSLTSTDRFLISTCLSEICGWSWEEIISQSVTKASWSISLPDSESNVERTEANCIITKQLESGWILLAGCSDKNTYIYDLGNLQLLTTLVGHNDYIHDVLPLSNGNEVITCSEDGAVKGWDLRCEGTDVYSFEPYKNAKLNRPKFGKWVGCLALDDHEDWLLCGGGPELSTWHMKTKTLTNVYKGSPEFAAHQAAFYEDFVIGAGTKPFIYQWHFNGDTKAKVPTDASQIYSLKISNHNDNDVLTSCGTSFKLDVCTNFLYKDFSLTLKL